MSTALTTETFYTRWKSVIDPATFIGMGLVGFGRLRAFEWIREPVMQQEMILSGAVNGLTIGLSHHIGNGDQSNSVLYQSVLTLIGFAVGVIIVPFAASKIMQNRVVLITTENAFRVATFNLLTKVFVYALFTLGESYYNTWNFPIFQNFDEMTPSTIGVFYNHFKSRRLLWNKVSFQKQLEFNRLLLKHGVPPLDVTNIDLDAHLTKKQLKTFRQLFDKKQLTSKQATILYKFHVPPEQREYKLEELPFIYPRRVDVKTLSDQQLKWHYLWIRAHNQLLPQSQIQAFVPHFFRLNLFPPNEKFVAELPFFPKIKTLTPPQVTYIAFFYQENIKKWDELALKVQIDLKKIFRQHGLDAHTLRLPTIREIPQLTASLLQEYRNRFILDQTLWDVKSERYRKTFNQKLEKYNLPVISLNRLSWKTIAKVTLIAVVIIGATAAGVIRASSTSLNHLQQLEGQRGCEPVQILDEPVITTALDVEPSRFCSPYPFWLNTTDLFDANASVESGQQPAQDVSRYQRELRILKRHVKQQHYSPTLYIGRDGAIYPTTQLESKALSVVNFFGSYRQPICDRMAVDENEEATPVTTVHEFSAEKQVVLVNSDNPLVEKVYRALPRSFLLQVTFSRSFSGCKRVFERMLNQQQRSSAYSAMLFASEDGGIYPTVELTNQQVVVHPLYNNTSAKSDQQPAQDVNQYKRELRVLKRHLEQQHYSPTLYLGRDGTAYPTIQQKDFNLFGDLEQPICDVMAFTESEDPAPVKKSRSFWKVFVDNFLLTRKVVVNAAGGLLLLVIFKKSDKERKRADSYEKQLKAVSHALAVDSRSKLLEKIEALKVNFRAHQELVTAADNLAKEVAQLKKHVGKVAEVLANYPFSDQQEALADHEKIRVLIECAQKRDQLEAEIFKQRDQLQAIALLLEEVEFQGGNTPQSLIEKVQWLLESIDSFTELRLEYDKVLAQNEKTINRLIEINEENDERFEANMRDQEDLSQVDNGLQDLYEQQIIELNSRLALAEHAEQEMEKVKEYLKDIHLQGQSDLQDALDKVIFLVHLHQAYLELKVRYDELLQEKEQDLERFLGHMKTFDTRYPQFKIPPERQQETKSRSRANTTSKIPKLKQGKNALHAVPTDSVSLTRQPSRIPRLSQKAKLKASTQHQSLDDVLASIRLKNAPAANQPSKIPRLKWVSSQ